MPLTNKQFVDLVAEMRVAQDGYFKSKRPEALGKSKAKEAQVDRAIKEFRNGQLVMWEENVGSKGR